MMNVFMRNWAVILLLALAFLMVTLLFETSWPVAYVYVDTVPTGADITDGTGFLWTSPAWIPVQSAGLTISLTHPDRVPLDTILVPEMSGQPVIIYLPYLFPVIITSEPEGADVVVNGILHGITPAVMQLDSPGLHHVRLTVDRIVSVQDSFTVLANSPCSLHWSLPSLYSDDLLEIPSGASGTLQISALGEPMDTLPGYFIARYEVTNADFREYLMDLEPDPKADTTNRWGRTDILEEIFRGDYPIPFYLGAEGGWNILDGLESLPVAGLSCDAAESYCRWLSSRDTTELIYRLPTEEEWLAAALAGGHGPWPWGSRRPDGNLLNLSDSNEELLRRHPSITDGFVQAAPVGSFPPNRWGMYDMAGNVWEWCSSVDPDSSPVARGGSWISSMDDCRCTARMRPPSELGFAFVGFRIAATRIDTSEER
jgi:hypothetical protein